MSKVIIELTEEEYVEYLKYKEGKEEYRLHITNIVYGEYIKLKDKSDNKKPKLSWLNPF